MVSVFPCLSLPRPPRHDERGAKLKYSLNTFIRHNKLHQLLSSRTELFCSTNNYILFPFGPRSQWSEGPETLSRQKLILHLGQPVWRSVCLLLIILSGIVPLTPNYTITYSELRSKSYIIIIETWSAKIGKHWIPHWDADGWYSEYNTTFQCTQGCFDLLVNFRHCLCKMVPSYCFYLSSAVLAKSSVEGLIR